MKHTDGDIFTSVMQNVLFIGTLIFVRIYFNFNLDNGHCSLNRIFLLNVYNNGCTVQSSSRATVALNITVFKQKAGC